MQARTRELQNYVNDIYLITILNHLSCMWLAFLKIICITLTGDFVNTIY